MQKIGPKENMCLLLLLLLILLYFFKNLNYNMTNIFRFGLAQSFCCLFVAKLPLTFAKLNSIPLNRARGLLNDSTSWFTADD